MPGASNTPKKRKSPGNEVPYNLRSKRRGISQQGQSSRTYSTVDNSQAGPSSSYDQSQATHREVSQTSVVQDDQSSVEQPQRVGPIESRPESDDDVIMANEPERGQGSNEDIAEESEDGEEGISHDQVLFTAPEPMRSPAGGDFVEVTPAEAARIVASRRVENYFEPKIVVEEYHPVFCWTYKTNGAQCVICMNDLEALCPSCENQKEEESSPGFICEITWGQCSHVFHTHCIKTWFEESKTMKCPLDRQPFEVKKQD